MSYFSYLCFFLGSIIVSFLITKIVTNFSIKNKLALSKIRDRDVHKTPVPRIGGLAIFIAFWAIIILIIVIKPNLLNFSGSNFLGVDKNLWGIILASILWLYVGLRDDLHGVKPWIKLIVQLICGFIIVGLGVKIWWLSNPLGGLNIILDNWTYLLVPLWVVLLMNVTNWFDGIDGLTPSISFVTMIILFFLSIEPTVNQSSTALLCIILAGVVLGFLPFNWNPAKIFLGDSGSGFLGLMLATFAIISGAKLATAFLVLGIPILDAIIVIFSRIKNKKSIFTADKSHLHHKFLLAGVGVKPTVIILSGISLLFGIIALKTQTQGKITAFLWLIATMGIILLILFLLRIKWRKSYGK